MDMHERVYGFPGILGSLDCMHLEWKNCPTVWRVQFTGGYKGSHPTLVLEAIADHRFWIWHAYFSVAGSNNDIKVFSTSYLFTEQSNSNGQTIEFAANRRQHHIWYYLVDDIYPRWLIFLKTISCPMDRKIAVFAHCKRPCARMWRGHFVFSKRAGQ
ncbi:uncharacterized protein LOC125195037 [Salvia hispanica]|uniref:uncharacterized protein LOC125195037 n=1 Tax=Salvia hispanica TaxID=49212 RepID=UPI002009DBA6|nr:uncharacterized protein LOC125195037 [Salvia hispanica]